MRSVVMQNRPRAEGEPRSGPCTLSSSENSIRSSGVQLRPMGEMFNIPLRNSMKVPLWIKAQGYWGRERKTTFPGEWLLSEALWEHAGGEKPCHS